MSHESVMPFLMLLSWPNPAQVKYLFTETYDYPSAYIMSLPWNMIGKCLLTPLLSQVCMLKLGKHFHTYHGWALQFQVWDVKVNIVLMEMKEREKCAPQVDRHIDYGSISFSTADDASVKLRRISIRECYRHIYNYGGSPLEFKVPHIFLLRWINIFPSYLGCYCRAQVLQ